MKIAVVLACCFTITFAYKFEDSFLEHASVVNAKKSTWTAGYNTYFAGKDWAEVKKVLGTKTERPEGEVIEKKVAVTAVLPDTFDSRTAASWTACGSRISEIRNQAACGSCWAVSAAIVATDRTCIASGGKFSMDLSAEDILACCGSFCGYGCDGGYPIKAMQYWAKTGLVTGGNYGDKTTCDPYSISPDAGSATTPKCVKSCQAGYPLTWANDLHKATSGYYVTGGESAIRQEILSHGPVQAAFDVYADFMHYRSGVYQHVTGGLEGGHAVTIIGWGTESGVPYWLVKNQWDTTWGDKGLFKIRRGTDECGFESGVVAGLPIV